MQSLDPDGMGYLLFSVFFSVFTTPLCPKYLASHIEYEYVLVFVLESLYLFKMCLF